MWQRTQDIRSRIVLMLLNEIDRGWRTLLSILVSLFAIPGRTVRLVQNPGTDTCWIRLAVNSNSTQVSRCRLTRKFLQAGKQIPDLTLLDFTDIRHEVCDIAS